MPEEEHQVTKSANKPEEHVGNQKSTMHVKVYAPYRVYFDGEAESITAVNGTGPFDILAQHHNFMTLLSPGDIIVRSVHGTETVPITRGIMHVKADKVIVFLDV